MSSLFGRFDLVIKKRNELLAKEEHTKGRKAELREQVKSKGIDVNNIGVEKKKRQKRKEELSKKLESELCRLEKILGIT